ncbi:LysR substrate-binding domain-containing protein [Microvirga flavescens]|uniref:LysR substrate-binding domain-containing protein n=1 Tax=Microvirga flavescens TaxID=2249811 RepID=UPI000DD8B23C|nr:LysR substrate-binding domain-containing protein [Microvirga flavescens]
MTRSLPSLTALRAFEATARTGSMLRAAESLFVTQSAISRHIRTLEEELGCALFRRVHRGLVLTVEGEALARTLNDAFTQIGEEVNRLRHRPEVLRVHAPPTFGIRWLMPRLSRFEARHPDIAVEVNITWNKPEPDPPEFHVGIVCHHTERWSQPQPYLTPLMTERLTPVCSPDFLEKWPCLAEAKGFEEVPLLHCTNHHTDWRLWSKGWGGAEFRVDRGEAFGTLDLAIRAAQAGRGLAIADIAMIEDDLRLGHLVMPLPDRIVPGESYYFVLRPTRKDRADGEALRSWILDELKA